MDGTFKKKIQNNFSNIFSSVPDSKFVIQIINSCKNLSLFTQTENSLEINKSKLSSLVVLFAIQLNGSETPIIIKFFP